MIDQARAYWKIASTFPADKEAVYPGHAAVQEFNLHEGKRVLEYGCGGGSDARSYYRRGNRVTACDIVPENVETTRARMGFVEMGTFRCVLLETSAPLPFLDGEFDLVNAHGVIHHIPDPAPVLKEFYRVLRTEGLLYVMLYTESLYLRVAHAAGIPPERITSTTSLGEVFGRFTDGSGTPYARAYTEHEGCALLEAAGFTVLSKQTYNDGDFRTFKATK